MAPKQYLSLTSTCIVAAVGKFRPLIFRLLQFRLNLTIGIYLGFGLLLISGTICGQKTFKVDIPDSLKVDADAIVLSDSTSIIINKLDQYRVYTSMSVLVQRPSKTVEHFNRFQLNYNKQLKIEFAQIVVTRPDGTMLTKVKKNDFKDISAMSQSTMYSDERVKYNEYVPTEYPYILNYQAELVSENTVFLPPFAAYASARHSVLNSAFLIENKTSAKLRFKKYDFETIPLVENHKEPLYFFKVQHLPSLKNDEDLSEDPPRVTFALDHFYLAGVEGSCTTWQEFGEWYQTKVLPGTDVLPPEAKVDILQLVGNETDPKKKIQKIYQYVQARTRYINVSIGIGGWKPMDATSVHKYGYGDCKALSNYTKALLEVAGIPSNLTIIHASNRRKSIDKEFVRMSGNHMIVNVPLEKDTIWLECTSQNMAYNLVAPSTQDRDALSIGSKGTIMVHTPALNSATNSKHNITSIILQPNGNIEGKLKTKCKGTYYFKHFEEASMSEIEYKKFTVEDLTAFQDLKILKTVRNNDKVDAFYESEIEFSSTKYCKKVGTELLFRVIPYDLVTNGLKKDNDPLGKHTLVGDQQVHEILFKLPAGYVLKDLPAPVEKQTTFGRYSLSFSVDNNELKVVRRFAMHDLKCDAITYNLAVTFLDEISTLENTKILLSPQN